MNKAKDLTHEAPRSPRVRLAGYALMARMSDKCRATLNGTNGEYHFDCPLDNMLFSFKGVRGDDVKAQIKSGIGDDDLVKWFNTHGSQRTGTEIKQWSDGVEAAMPYEDPDKREWFEGECSRLGLDPKNTTLFTMLEKDDQASFKQYAKAA